MDRRSITLINTVLFAGNWSGDSRARCAFDGRTPRRPTCPGGCSIRLARALFRAAITRSSQPDSPSCRATATTRSSPCRLSSRPLESTRRLHSSLSSTSISLSLSPPSRRDDLRYRRRRRPPHVTPRSVSSFPRPRAPRPLFLCRFARLFISPLSLPPWTGATLAGPWIPFKGITSSPGAGGGGGMSSPSPGVSQKLELALSSWGRCVRRSAADGSYSRALY
jgi:hypothetical protein